MDHLTDPEIVRHFEWDAQKVYRYDGTNYTRIYTEPCTGKRFWDTQVKHFVFRYKAALIIYKDVITRRGENGWPRTLRGQDPALVIRNGKGVPRHGEDSKSPSVDAEWRWNRGRSGRGMASDSAPEIIHSLNTNLIAISNIG